MKESLSLFKKNYYLWWHNNKKPKMNEQQVEETFKPTLLNLIRPLVNEQFENGNTLELFINTAIECAMSTKRKTSVTVATTAITTATEEPPKKKIRVVPDAERCLALTKKGKQCACKRQERDTLCKIHLRYNNDEDTPHRIKKKRIPTSFSDLGLEFSDQDD